MHSVIRHLRRTMLPGGEDGLNDRQLLERFLARRDGEAFEALVRRHGPMVLGVCRRVIGNVHDAEDAFQATFLVLVRRAAALAAPELLGNWLYGVAYRTALEAKARKARRSAREKQVADMPQPRVDSEEVRQDLQFLLDEELNRLPEPYRVPIVLCDLEGLSRKDVARQLNLPEGTLSSRLATGRKKLADNLTRRGVVLSSAALAAVLGRSALTACVPSALVVSVTRAATLLAAGQAAGVSAEVAALTEGVLHAMVSSKLKLATVVLVLVALSGAVIGVGPQTTASQAQPAEAAAPMSRPLAGNAGTGKDREPPAVQANALVQGENEKPRIEQPPKEVPRKKAKEDDDRRPRDGKRIREGKERERDD
jgi:RNA polymerase sigma factor (sigma-70 family)